MDSDRSKEAQSDQNETKWQKKAPPFGGAFYSVEFQLRTYKVDANIYIKWIR